MPFVNIRVNVELDQAGIQAVTDAGTFTRFSAVVESVRFDLT